MVANLGKVEHSKLLAVCGARGVGNAALCSYSAAGRVAERSSSTVVVQALTNQLMLRKYSRFGALQRTRMVQGVEEVQLAAGTGGYYW